MNLIKVLYAFFSVSGLGVIPGPGLAYASGAFAIKKNEKLEKPESTLAGLNCGVCGYPGCSSYADTIANGGDEVLTKCAPVGSDVAAKLVIMTGMEVDVAMEKMVAQVHCCGGKKTSKYKYEYSGVNDCNAIYFLFNGDKEECMGCKICGKKSPEGSFKVENYLAVINYKIEGERESAAGICPAHYIIKNRPHPKMK